MRVNVYAEDLTPYVSLVTRESDGQEFAGLRFMVGDGNDAVTFWGTSVEQLDSLFTIALEVLDVVHEGR